MFIKNWSKYFLTALIILTGSIVLLAIIFPNGDWLCFNNICGAGINRKYAHDSLWHIALTKIGFNQIPFSHPSQANSPLVGYNYLLNLLMFILLKIGINPFFSFYKLLPIVFIILFPYLIIRYTKITKKNLTALNALLFFCYFGCSLGFAISYSRWRLLTDTALWEFPSAQTLQSGSILHNLQYALSLLVLLYLFPFLEQKKFSLKEIVIVVLMSFIATGFKLYAGLTILLLFGFKTFFLLFKEKKAHLAYLKISLAVLGGLILSVLVFYSPFEAGKTGAVFVWAPFSFTHQMIENPLLFYSRSLADARYFLYAQKTFSKKLVLIETYTVFLFLIYNLGSRLIAFPYLLIETLKKKIKPESLAVFFTYLTIFLFTVFFVQKGDWFNTMQFLFYGVFLMNFLAANAFAKILEYKQIWLKLLLTVLILLFTLPGNIDLLSFYRKTPQNYLLISEAELNALGYLEKQPKGVVFTPTIIPNLYISAFSGKPSYLNDIQQLRIMMIDFSKREKLLNNLNQTNLSKIKANYFYLNTQIPVDKQFLKRIKQNSEFKLIYQNKNIFIYSSSPRPRQ